MGRHLLVVLTNAVEGRDDEFNRWYDEVHLPDVLAVPGFVAAQRFELAQAVRGSGTHRYLALYEIDAADVGTATAALGQAAAEMQISDAMDGANVVALAFTELGARKEAEHAG